VELFKFSNLGLRFLIELCTLAAMCYWGFQKGNGYGVKIILGVGVPLLAAVLWGLFVSPKASIPTTGLLRLLLEICILGAGALALYVAGNHKLAMIYGIVMIVNLTLTYVWKQHGAQ
jgi:hypothetical protein